MINYNKIQNNIFKHPFYIRIINLKRVSYWLIIAQFLDILTTFIGVSLMGLMELNPMGFTFQIVMLKILITFLVVYVLEHEKYFKFMWAVPITVLIFPLWNLLNIVLDLIL